MEENQEEEDYQEQIEYIRTKYPDNQVKLEGYGTTNLDVVSNKADLFSIIDKMIFPSVSEIGSKYLSENEFVNCKSKIK